MITKFSGRYSFLSNFYHLYPDTVSLSGIRYPTVEHAYQAAKTLDTAKRRYILEQPTPGKARKYGRKLPLREDWDEVKLQVMRNLLVQKFRIPSLRDKLQSTVGITIVEANSWGDTYWGVDEKTGAGENHLGNLLMEVRAESFRA